MKDDSKNREEELEDERQTVDGSDDAAVDNPVGTTTADYLTFECCFRIITPKTGVYCRYMMSDNGKRR
jgi:hypothetical protein